ncbi:hypothetical protein [Exiguobacterium sp. R-39]|uniref:hypothetical protein n=1 Tax=Exiguobacterium sp. R-39 TaxID=3416708 RepID=UPI003CF3179B
MSNWKEELKTKVSLELRNREMNSIKKITEEINSVFDEFIENFSGIKYKDSNIAWKIEDANNVFTLNYYNALLDKPGVYRISYYIDTLKEKKVVVIEAMYDYSTGRLALVHLGNMKPYFEFDRFSEKINVKTKKADFTRENLDDLIRLAFSVENF